RAGDPGHLAGRGRAGRGGRHLPGHGQQDRFLYGLGHAPAHLRRRHIGRHRQPHGGASRRAGAAADRGAPGQYLYRQRPAAVRRLQARHRLRHHGGGPHLAPHRPAAREAVLMDTGTILYLISLATMIGLYAILTLGLNLQWGFAGLFNAGIAGFFAIGAYTTSILTTAESADHLGGFNLPVPLGILAGVLLSAALGYAVARICLRLKSDYLAIATI